MRRQTYTQTYTFRAPPCVLEQAEAKAERTGISLAELVRQALRRELQEAA